MWLLWKQRYWIEGTHWSPSGVHWSSLTVERWQTTSNPTICKVTITINQANKFKTYLKLFGVPFNIHCRCKSVQTLSLSWSATMTTQHFCCLQVSSAGSYGPLWLDNTENVMVGYSIFPPLAEKKMHQMGKIWGWSQFRKSVLHCNVDVMQMPSCLVGHVGTERYSQMI